jgi:hypothetical protein
VFLGVLNYVAYRDIFERRAANRPEAVIAADAKLPANAMQAQVSTRRYK